MILFLALCFVATAVAGLCAFVIFWPLTLVHVRDRHAALHERFGEGAFLGKDALRWLLRGDYVEANDANLTGLALPARISVIVIGVALLFAALLWLVSLAV